MVRLAFLSVTLAAALGCSRSPQQVEGGGRSATRPAADPVVQGRKLSEWLVVALDDSEIGPQLEAQHLIMRYGKTNPDEAAPYVLQLLEKGSTVADILFEDVRPSEALLPTMMPLLQHRDEDVRMWAIRAIGNLGDKGKSALPALQQALKAAQAKDLQGERGWLEQAIAYINGKDAVFFPLKDLPTID
jgi:hypothetical protein